MYHLKVEQTFDSAHFLKGYAGKCSNIHGHTWRVMVTVSSETLQSEGSCKDMLEDFGNLKQDLKDEVDCLDHCLVIESGTLKQETYDALLYEGFRIVSLPFRSTAENLSKYFYDKMTNRGYTVTSCIVYETPTNYAEYTKD